MNTIYVAMRASQPTHTALTPEAAQRDALRAEKLRAGSTDYDYKWFEQGDGEWRLMRKPKSTRLGPAEKTALKVVAVALTPDEKTLPVDGPFRVRVRATTSGAELDVSHYLGVALLSLAAAVEEDPESVLEDLVDLAAWSRTAQGQGKDSHATHERDERLNKLLTEIADDGTIPVYGAQVGALAARLAEIAAPRPVPGQREAGAA